MLWLYSKLSEREIWYEPAGRRVTENGEQGTVDGRWGKAQFLGIKQGEKLLVTFAYRTTISFTLCLPLVVFIL